MFEYNLKIEKTQQHHSRQFMQGCSLRKPSRKTARSSGQTAVKVPTTPQQLFDLSDSLARDEGIHLHGSAAGNVAWILLDTGEGLSALDRQLQALQMPGLVIRGPCDRPRLGTWKSWEVERTIQAAMDPPRKFPRWMHTAEHLPA